jgi:predicted ribosome quality control (RQC) complex YloA/Tae2 family protein
MNNFYALIYLTRELKNRCIGTEFHFSTSPHKNVWESYIGRDGSMSRLIFSSNPKEAVLFADHYRPAKRSNITKFFNELTGKKIITINLAENDRYITLEYDDQFELLFQVFGNKPNIFLIRDDKIIGSFKSPEEHIGKFPPKPRPASSPPAEFKEGLSPKKVITKTNPKFPRHLIPAVTEHYGLDQKSSDEVRDITLMLTEAMLNEAEFRVLKNGNLCLIPQHLLPVENLKTFDDINAAIRYVYYETSRERRLSARIQSVKPRIETAIRKTESAISQLEKADKGLERSETYEQFGHILMAHAHQEPEDHSGTITLTDFYNENKPVDIPIKPNKTIAENAQIYYEKSNKAIRNVEESRRRLTESKQKLKQLKKLKNSMDSIEKVYEFDEWFKTHENELDELGILSKSKKGDTAPYRKLTIDGFEVWLGKNARSNDHLTTDAHKEDVWMHARGVSGSHLVIRMNNHKEMPPKPVLLKAAALAAWNSKARGAGLAPVIVTKRKYVTKPKGAPAGTVRVQREDVEMVKPQKF